MTGFMQSMRASFRPSPGKTISRKDAVAASRTGIGSPLTFAVRCIEHTRGYEQSNLNVAYPPAKPRRMVEHQCDTSRSRPFLEIQTRKKRREVGKLRSSMGSSSAAGSTGEDPEGLMESSTESTHKQKEEEAVTVKGITYPDVAFYVNAVYWSTLLLAVLTGNEWLTQAAHFQNFVTVMLLSSSFFALTSLFKWISDVRKRENRVKQQKDAKQTAMHGFNVFVWLGFVLWYVAPPIASAIEWTGTVGAVMSLFGLILAFSAALMVGSWSFLGTQTQIPNRIVTTGPYALLRHPQGLGNMLFLLGFSLAGGSLFSFAAFLVAFVLYVKVLVPAEEAALEGAFHLKYSKYKEKTPAFAWALLLLLVVEVVLLWRYAPYASPIDVAPPGKA